MQYTLQYGCAPLDASSLSGACVSLEIIFLLVYIAEMLIKMSSLRAVSARIRIRMRCMLPAPHRAWQPVGQAVAPGAAGATASVALVPALYLVSSRRTFERRPFVRVRSQNYFRTAWNLLDLFCVISGIVFLLPGVAVLCHPLTRHSQRIRASPNAHPPCCSHAAMRTEARGRTCTIASAERRNRLVGRGGRRLDHALLSAGAAAQVADALSDAPARHRHVHRVARVDRDRRYTPDRRGAVIAAGSGHRRR